MFDFNGNNNEAMDNNSAIVEAKQPVNILDQTEPHHSRSKKYLLVSTREILNIFEELGFHYDEKSLWTSKSRKSSRVGKGRHMITLRHPDLRVAPELRNELVPQLYLWNSYDGTTQIKLVIGFWRFVCENRMALGTGIVDPIVFKHIAGENTREARKSQLKETIKQAGIKFKQMSERFGT